MYVYIEIEIEIDIDRYVFYREDATIILHSTSTVM